MIGNAKRKVVTEPSNFLRSFQKKFGQ